MSNLRSKESLKTLMITSERTQHEIASSLESLRGRWFALREHYLGIGAEDVESEMNVIFAQTERLVESLAQWQDNCQCAEPDKEVTDAT